MQFDKKVPFEEEELKHYGLQTNDSNSIGGENGFDFDNDNADNDEEDDTAIIQSRNSTSHVSVVDKYFITNSNHTCFEVHIKVNNIAQQNIRLNTDKNYLHINITPKQRNIGIANFNQSFRLPYGANTQKISNQYRKGYLVVSVPLNE